MSATRQEGPSFWAWISGRFTYPPAKACCSECGKVGADPEVARELRDSGLKEMAGFANLCDGCRRKARDRSVVKSMSGKF